MVKIVLFVKNVMKIGREHLQVSLHNSLRKENVCIRVDYET